MASTPKPVIWMGDSLDVLREFPAPVQDEMGYALYLSQIGGVHAEAKPLKGFGSGVVEVSPIIAATHSGRSTRCGWPTRCMCCTRFRKSRRRVLRLRDGN